MDYDKFKKELKNFEKYGPEAYIAANRPSFKDDVNQPAHYTRGSSEAIDVIEDAIQDAPTAKEGFLQGQVLKYILRMWLKDNPQQDAEKAQWYLERLIEKLRYCD